MAAKEMVDYLENGNIVNSVNFPACSLPRTDKIRVCITQKNLPNLVSSITGVFGNNHINIDNMINKSRGNFAYTIIDADSDVNDDTVKAIEAVDGVIGVRVIK